MKKIKDWCWALWLVLTMSWMPTNTGRYEVGAHHWYSRFWRRKAAQRYADRLNSYDLTHPMYGPRWSVRDRWSGSHD